jgi:membrane protein DedA with SNARE-associated domain
MSLFVGLLACPVWPCGVVVTSAVVGAVAGAVAGYVAGKKAGQP